MGYTKKYNIAESVTATSVESGVIELRNAKRVSIFGTRAGHTSGTTTISVAVSGDGANFTTYNRLVTNVANTNEEGVARASSLALAAAGTNYVSFSPEDNFSAMKVTVATATDGESSCYAIVEYDNSPD